MSQEISVRMCDRIHKGRMWDLFSTTDKLSSLRDWATPLVGPQDDNSKKNPYNCSERLCGTGPIDPILRSLTLFKKPQTSRELPACWLAGSCVCIMHVHMNLCNICCQVIYRLADTEMFVCPTCLPSPSQGPPETTLLLSSSFGTRCAQHLNLVMGRSTW